MISHIAVGAVDPEGLAAFYVESLGLERRHVARDESGIRAVWLDLGANVVLMIERSSGEVDGRAQLTPPPVGRVFIALAIQRESLPEFEARLLAAGVTISKRSDYTIYFRDPEGNRVGLSWFNADEYLATGD